MRDRYLEVTFRKGKPWAAYLYLPRAVGERSVRTETAEPGILVDYSAQERPIGVEITAPGRVSVEALNGVLDRLGVERVTPEEFARMAAA